MKKKLTVSIGIPAYNEENDIKSLLDSVLSQTFQKSVLNEIIVVSDASTDRTNEIVRSYNDKRIKLIINRKRIGQQLSQNKILKVFKGNVLVLLEADTIPYDDMVIEALVDPLTSKDKKLGMVVGVPEAVKPHSIYEKVLYHGSELKKNLFGRWRNGDNLFTCGGHSMKALSRDFCKVLKWPRNVPEDAFAYLKLIESGFTFRQTPDAKVWMRNVTNLNDRMKQCNKFLNGRKSLYKYFGSNLVKHEYQIPLSIFVKVIPSEFVKKPFWMTTYLLEVILNRVLTAKRTTFNALYQPYLSSKRLLVTTNSRTPSCHKKTLSVGIPVYNEGKNIKKLLLEILTQTPGGYILEKIILISDGSTDDTVMQAESVESPLIKIIDSKKRLGKSKRLNQIFKIARSSTLFLIDGDCGLDVDCFRNFADVLSDNDLCLVAGNTIPYKPVNFIQKGLYSGTLALKGMSENIDEGVNVYSFRGTMIAVGKKLYKKIKVPPVAGTDAFLYFSAVRRGLKCGYSRKSLVYYCLPKTAQDHFKQSSRFISSKGNMGKYFGEWIYKYYHIPKLRLIVSTASVFLKKPVELMFYIVFRAISMTLSIKDKDKSFEIWEISHSTK